MDKQESICHVVAENMRYYRRQLGYTQEKLAEESGMGRTYVGSIEQEKANPSLDHLDRIATALGIDLEELTSRKNLPSYRGRHASRMISNGPEVIYSRNFAPGDLALCRWDNQQIVMVPITDDEQTKLQFITASLLMRGEKEHLAEKVSASLAALKTLATIIG